MAETRLYNTRSKTLGTFTCMWCGKDAVRPMADAIRQRFCSNGCSKRARGGLPTHLPEYMDDSFGHWLAGFTDGEGTFILQVQKEVYVTPRFVIRLRKDDKQILEETRDYLGFGDVEDVKQNFNPSRPNNNPCSVYECRSFGECNGIMELFERYPLRAKKARDFAIWSEAIRLGMTDCEDRAAFLKLATDLSAVRQYID